MSILDTTSLSETIDTFNDAVFYGRTLIPTQAQELAYWLISREGRSRCYNDLPSPTPLDYERGARLFSGERVTSRAGIGHILGEEACRALILLDVKDESIQEALDAITTKIANFFDPRCGHGFFCCTTCSVALWRHLSVSPLKNAEERIAAGMKILSTRHDDTGKWHSFPFYYTLLALNSLPNDLARDELHYAAPRCERLLKRPPADDRYAFRRRDLLMKTLEVIA